MFKEKLKKTFKVNVDIKSVSALSDAPRASPEASNGSSLKPTVS